MREPQMYAATEQQAGQICHQGMWAPKVCGIRRNEVLLQLLVGVVDQQLLVRVDAEDLVAKYVEQPNERVRRHATTTSSTSTIAVTAAGLSAGGAAVCAAPCSRGERRIDQADQHIEEPLVRRLCEGVTRRLCLSHAPAAARAIARCRHTRWTDGHLWACERIATGTRELA